VPLPSLLEAMAANPQQGSLNSQGQFVLSYHTADERCIRQPDSNLPEFTKPCP
jgi:hypothetical protein